MIGGENTSATVTAPTRAQVLAKNINRYVPAVDWIVSYSMLTQKSVKRRFRGFFLDKIKSKLNTAVCDS